MDRPRQLGTVGVANEQFRLRGDHRNEFVEVIDASHDAAPTSTATRDHRLRGNAGPTRVACVDTLSYSDPRPGTRRHRGLAVRACSVGHDERLPDRCFPKALIRSAAGQLFLERGYHNVSVTDVAEALDIAPSALYHHYRNKQDLLLHAVLAAQEGVDALVREATSLDDAIGALAAMVVGPHRVLVVWEREARNLETSQRRLIREGEAEIVAHLTALLRADRPDLDDADSDLVARAVLGVLGSRA